MRDKSHQATPSSPQKIRPQKRAHRSHKPHHKHRVGKGEQAVFPVEYLAEIVDIRGPCCRTAVLRCAAQQMGAYFLNKSPGAPYFFRQVLAATSSLPMV